MNNLLACGIFADVHTVLFQGQRHQERKGWFSIYYVLAEYTDEFFFAVVCLM